MSEDMGGTQDHPMGNLELFLSLRASDSSQISWRSNRIEDAWGVGDLVFALEHGRYRLMGEYNLSTEEHDFERLQVGIEPVPDTLLWVGRFHQPGSAWNDEFHHGAYLQTSISRPSIELWEDEGGILPQHLVGALAESRFPVGDGHGLRAALGAGYGSSMLADGFEPIDLFAADARGRHFSTSAMLAWLPSYLGPSGAGLLYAHHRSGVVEQALSRELGADAVSQDVLGAYGHYVGDRWRALAVLYHVQVALEPYDAAARSEDFLAGYAQVESVLRHGLTLYARHENSPRAGSTRLANSFVDSLVLHGNFIGLRQDLPHRQALTLELSRSTVVQGPVNRVRLQWSAALP